MKLSFIVIGKDEGMRLSLCLQSILNTIKYNKIVNYEIIYVDSNSSDDSLQRANSFNKVKVILLTGDCNAAIARNIGAKVASGEILLFIDGDMELIPDNFSHLYLEGKQPRHVFMSGNFVDWYYSTDGTVEAKKVYHDQSYDTYSYVTGGLFLTTRSCWEEVGGMREEFRRSQDLDYGLRMAMNGYPLLRTNHIICIHHTIEYNSRKRLIRDIRNGNWLYRGLLYKKNLLNRYMFKEYLIREMTLLILLITTLLCLLGFGFHVAIFYFVSLIAKLIYKNTPPAKYFRSIMIWFLVDINTLLSLFFFWPRRPVDIEYVIQKNIVKTTHNA